MTASLLLEPASAADPDVSGLESAADPDIFGLEPAGDPDFFGLKCRGLA
ncbi:hypothetical protein [Goekera deserti]|uniref:Uncharacterized protein n=1 Tax=Goekera deserti TaxID=2497753 RepID=A0A7K3WEG1_9ACTN|nr:hypothetical protein [Goekera deserti]NDI48736.1 hypothetical protein [Goekera deserti]NEL54885.1 hypothetical protein [Goekera deserti]